MPERQNWRGVYNRIYTDAILSHCRKVRKGFLEEEAFKATIIKDFLTGSKTYKAYYCSSHDEDCMIITALILVAWRDACAITLAQAPAAMRGDTDCNAEAHAAMRGDTETWEDQRGHRHRCVMRGKSMACNAFTTDSTIVSGGGGIMGGSSASTDPAPAGSQASAQRPSGDTLHTDIDTGFFSFCEWDEVWGWNNPSPDATWEECRDFYDRCYGIPTGIPLAKHGAFFSRVQTRDAHRRARGARITLAEDHSPYPPYAEDAANPGATEEAMPQSLDDLTMSDNVMRDLADNSLLQG
jgi:hypothetical protein